MCPACGSKDIIFWSGYWRYVVVGEYARRLFIHRTRCKSCGKTHSILPWFIIPFRTHLASVIGYCIWLKIVKGKSIRALAKELRINRSTISGWIGRFLTQAQNIYEHCLYLLHSIKTHPPPVSDIKSGALLFLFTLFSLTQFSDTHSFLFSYVSLLTKGRFLTNTTSPLRIRS